MTKILRDPLLLTVASALIMLCLIGWLIFRNAKDKQAFEVNEDDPRASSARHLKHEEDKT